MQRNNIYLRLYDIEKQKEFVKHFECEFDKDKFKRKLRYSRKIMIVDENDTDNYKQEEL